MSNVTLFSYLRLMDESDLNQVFTIEQKSYDFPWTLNGFEKSLDQGLNYVFSDIENQMLGYCCILPVLDEAHILNICVAPKFQRKSVAKKAFLKILENLKDRDFKVVFLEVRKSNSAAHSLYRQLGFTEDGIRKGYYRSQVWDEETQDIIEEKEDAILMSFAIESQ